MRKPRKRSCDDSDPNNEDDDEILGSDDDEQESPKDYCKVLTVFHYQILYFLIFRVDIIQSK